MKKHLLIGSLLATVIFVMPDNSWSWGPARQNSYSGAIPRNLIITANDWMYANALPYTHIHPTYTKLGKGLWETRWTWKVASGTIYDATLIINPAGELLNDPVIDELVSWPF